MKRTLSLILAALLLASAVSCGKPKEPVTDPAETKTSETSASETAISETEIAETSVSETEIAETEAPSYGYDTSLITENSLAKAHIVLPEGASDNEKTGAEELAYHIKLVSGAEIPVTNTAEDGSLPIIIATPASLPELEELFPEDLSWLRTLEETAEDGSVKNWGDDGFSIRANDGKIYIFGANSVGALNGVYDFIEENLDVIWIAESDDGIIYDEMPTISVVSVDYREKSPFSVFGVGGVFGRRNKVTLLISTYGGDANVKNYVIQSPIYDPNITEYWDTDAGGNPLKAAGTHTWQGGVATDTSKQINFWSQLTADTVAATAIAKLDSFSDADRPVYFNVCMEDGYKPTQYPEMSLPFEYAPGEFVDPSDPAYLSTVYFTFINRVAEKVYEKYPEVYINTLAYSFAIAPPKCEIRDNVSIWFAPLDDDLTIEGFRESLDMDDDSASNTKVHATYFEGWAEKTSHILVYNYYFVNFTQGLYERPLWYRISNDFRYYADNGVRGFYTCGHASDGNSGMYPYQPAIYNVNPEYSFTSGQAYDMNRLSYWIYYKLMWDPYEDVDALIAEYCDKVYGEAGPYMQEYYRLLSEGWDVGADLVKEEFNMTVTWTKDIQYYFDYFVDIETDDGVYIYEAIRENLSKAWETVNEKGRKFLTYIYECYMDIERFLN